MRKTLKQTAALVTALAFLTACSGGGTGGGTAASTAASTAGAAASTAETVTGTAEQAGGEASGDYALTTAITSTDQITIRISEDASEIHPSHIALEQCFKAPLEAASNGNITVEIYPNSMLGSLTENVNSMQMGDLEMAYLNDSILSGFIPEFAVVGLPYLFTSVDAVHNAMAGDFGATLSQKVYDELGLVNLGWCDVGFRNLTNSVKPIEKADDLSGLKIRTMTNDLHVAYFSHLGALPTPMAFNELYTAMQQGTVDGQENPTAMIWNNNIHEVQKYMTVSEHVWTSTGLMIAKGFFEGLPQDYQDAIREAGANTTALQRDMITQQNQDLLQNIIDYGVEVVELDDAAKAEFQEKAKESVWVTAVDLYGQELIDQADSYNN